MTDKQSGMPVAGAGALPTPADGQTVALDAQLCFPLYAASRLLTRRYQPLLERFGLTYPQYVVLMVLWERAPRTVGEIGMRALLNSNTLTPLLKRLEAQGLVRRRRAAGDERVVEVHLTERGELLQAECACIQHALRDHIAIASEKLVALKAGLEELLERLRRLELSDNADFSWELRPRREAGGQS